MRQVSVELVRAELLSLKLIVVLWAWTESKVWLDSLSFPEGDAGKSLRDIFCEPS